MRDVELLGVFLSDFFLILPPQEISYATKVKNLFMPKWFLFVFYQAVKSLTRFATRVYFASIVVRPKSARQIARLKPTILVSNHPNTLIDAIFVASRVQPMVHFLANVSLFRHPFLNWFLNTFYCIPIARPQDAGGQPLANESAFDRATDFLAAGGCLYIAAEGTSFMERRLRPLKTGAARIAFDAEQRNGFRLGLQIIPVGINYSAANEFRSRVVMNIGSPIQIADYQRLYEKNPYDAAHELTNVLEQKMQQLLIHTNNAAEEATLTRIEKMLESEQSLGAARSYERSQKILAFMRIFEKESPEQCQYFRRQLDAYHFQLKKNRLADQTIFDASQKKSLPKSLFQSLLWIIGFPIFAWGWLHNALPTFFAALTAKKIRPYIGYVSSIKLLSGILLFTFSYSLEFCLAKYFLSNYFFIAVYMFSLPFFAWFAWEYLQFSMRVFSRWRVVALQSALCKKLTQERLEIRQQLFSN